MKKALMIASSLALVSSLAACKKADDATKPVATASTDGMANMPMKAGTKHGTGEGEVVSVNAASGAVSIKHGPIQQLGWPGMTMGFTAKPDMLNGIGAGDKVSFEIDWDGKEGMVTSIKKMK